MLLHQAMTQKEICTGGHKKGERKLLQGVDESRKSCIIAIGSGESEPAGRHSRVEEASSQGKIKRRLEVDPIVRFFTSTG